MKLSKIILAILAVFIFSLIIGMVTCGGVFNWIYKIEPVSVWKEFSMPLFIGSEIIMSSILVIVYAFFGKNISCECTCGADICKSAVSNKIKKGILFGFFVYLVGNLTGAICTYAFMNVASAVIIYWIIWGLIVMPLKGLIISLVYGE